jgi:L-ascorbate metabolism protein UlaG (beta-lactamase superfamily)
MIVMMLKWLGHASFLLETGGKKIYIDPYAGEYDEKADAVLISHSHGDHCDLEKLAMVRTPETVIYTSEACAEGIPPGNVVTMSPGEEASFHGIVIHAVEAYNFKRFRSPGVPYHPVGIQVAFIVESEGKRVYHVGDSDYLPSMNELGNITLALIPIMGRATMDVDEAVEAAIGIAPEMAVPVHWRDSDPEEFKAKVEARSTLKVILMKDGETLTL